ncbi:MAG: amidohydrolase family protein [Pacificimonas sp.]
MAISAGAGWWPVRAEPIVFDGATVLTMDDEGSIISDARVVVDDGAILKVGAAAAVEIPVDATVIDASGQWLMPGLADMHVHYNAADQGLLYVANGITTVRNMSGWTGPAEWDALAEAGILIGPKVSQPGPIIDGKGSFLGENGLVVESPEQAIGAVRTMASAGFDAVKLYEFLTPDSYRAAAATAREKDLKIYTHTPGSMTLLDVLAEAPDTIEHFDGYEAALVRDGFEAELFLPFAEQWANIDETKIDGVLDATLEAGTWNVPTLVLERGQLYAADPESFMQTPQAAYIPADMIDGWRAMDGFLRSFFPFTEAKREAKVRLLSRLREKGAPVLIGTDAPNPYVAPGFAIHDELATFVEAGYRNDEILMIATRDAARFFGDDAAGRIVEGAAADLLLLSSDPRADLGVLRRPEGVLIAGHWYDRKLIDVALAARAAMFSAAAEAVNDSAE